MPSLTLHTTYVPYILPIERHKNSQNSKWNYLLGSKLKQKSQLEGLMDVIEYAYIHIHIYIHIHRHRHTQTHIHVYIYIHIHIHTHMCIYIYIRYIHIHTYIYILYIYIYKENSQNLGDILPVKKQTLLCPSSNSGARYHRDCTWAHRSTRKPLGDELKNSRTWGIYDDLWIPSGELTFCHGKSPFVMGKSTINGHVQLLC